MGAAKTGGNYASSLVPQQEAIDAGLRPGGLPRRRGGEVRRGARRHEHVLRLQGRPDRHPRARHHPRGHHPRSIIELAGKMGHQVEERRFSIDEWRDGVDQRRHHRDLRLRHRGRGHAGRRAQVGGRLGARAGLDRPDHRGSARRWSTCSSAGPRTPSAGCTGSSERRVTVGRAEPRTVVQPRDPARTTRSTGSPASRTPSRRSTATTWRRCSGSWPGGSRTRTWPRT